MKRPFQQRSSGSLVASVALHVVIAAALIQIVFRYPLAQLDSVTTVSSERLQYVTVPVRAPERSGGNGRHKGESPAPELTPTSTWIPNTVSLAPSRDSSQGTAIASGVGSGATVSARVIGVVPRQPDDKIALGAGSIPPRPLTLERIDSATRVVINSYNDSAATVAKTRDWTLRDQTGRRWGWDSLGVYLGDKGMMVRRVPSFPVEVRGAAFIRRDIVENAWRAVSDAEFRKAVKRIRERNERERLTSPLLEPETHPAR